MTIEISLDLGDRSVPITIGSRLLDRAEWWSRHLRTSTVVIVTNETVGPLYGNELRETILSLGPRVLTSQLPDGEVHKTWPTLDRIFDTLLAGNCDRQTVIVALGGGVIGDLAGFAAATYQRGIPFIQVPTTLLAQVDSSVGGKTGINHPLGKNMVGAFYQPRAVLIDTATLETLPAREFSAGLAEVIKHGAACDADYFDWLERHLDAILARDSSLLGEAIAWSCRIKARIVAADERESGLRAVLNFGHTFGHAIETGLGYGVWLHGEAVAAGMCLAAELSVRQHTLTRGEADRLVRLVGRAGLPVTAPGFDPARWLELMVRDKKSAGGSPRFVLLRGLGGAYLTGVAHNAVEALLADSASAGPDQRAHPLMDGVGS